MTLELELPLEKRFELEEITRGYSNHLSSAWPVGFTIQRPWSIQTHDVFYKGKKKDYCILKFDDTIVNIYHHNLEDQILDILFPSEEDKIFYLMKGGIPDCYLTFVT